MEMLVSVPVPPTDFKFDSACSSPYISSPPSPKRIGDFYFSAPTSPTRASAIYHDFNHLSSVIPFDWEEKPGKPKSNDTQVIKEEDFAFDFSGQLERTSLSADELFDGGKIRPLKPPPRLQFNVGLDESVTRKSPVSSPRSPIEQGKKLFHNAFSPRNKKEFDPFKVAIEQTRRGEERGRERVSVFSSFNSNSKSSRRVSRSLSPFRDSEVAWEEEEEEQQQQQSMKNPKPSSKKWRLKDFLLFRSASEGRATKYTALSKKNEDEVKNSSFRSTGNSGSLRKGPVSAHELHYSVNRAVSEEMRKKTFLPYKQGLLGCLGFNPTVHGLAKGLNSTTRG